jgi:hypothetical protein
MKNIAKIIIFLLILSNILFLVFHLKNKSDRDDEYHLFLNHVYYYIDDIEKDLETILIDIENGKTNSMDKKIAYICQNLFKLDQLIKDGFFISDELWIDESIGFDIIGETLLGIANEKVSKSEIFFDDNYINDTGLAFLEQLQLDIDNLHNELSKEDDYNPKIAKKDFRNIIMNFFEKWEYSKENYENYGGLINKYNPHKIKIGDKVGNWVVDEFIEEETELREITFKGSVDLKGRFYFNRNIDGYLFDIEDDSDIPIPINHAYSYLCWIDNMEAVFEKYGKELNEENLYHFKVNKVVYSNGITLSAISLVIEEIMD